jgi:hypothetical protein
MHNGTAELYERLNTLSIAETPGTSSNSDLIGCLALVTALRRFNECVRYLNTRRSTGAVLDIAKEADVQDALYLMLRLWVTDLVIENPMNMVANQYSIKDFLVPQARTVIEAKYIRDKNHGKHVMHELSQDIETYRHHPLCDNIIFFLWDADTHIPNQEQLRLAVESDRVYGGRPLTCHLIVLP